MRNTRVNVEDLFESLGREEKQEIREFEFDKNESLEILTKSFMHFLSENMGEPVHTAYNRVENYFNDFNNVKAIDITKFIILNAEFSTYPSSFIKDIYPDSLGAFISRLINESKEEYFKLIRPPEVDFADLGYLNTKEIEIFGDCESGIGVEMRRGKITINGYAGLFVGEFMSGGEIFVNGNAGPGVGCNMRSGKIFINGEISGSQRLTTGKGEIYHNGELISYRLGDIK